MELRLRLAIFAFAAGTVLTPPISAAAGEAETIPRYAHIFVIIDENHTTNEIIGNPAAPTFTRLAKEYGFASNYYAVRHPSEPNYVALVGGDTFGITDDDAFYCKPGSTQWGCAKSGRAGYVDHTVGAPNLTTQLEAAGLSWKGYFESIPEPGSLVYRWPGGPATGKQGSLYAVKHNGFMTFKNVQDDPRRAERIVGFDVLEHDIAANTLPNFAHIVPDLCDDMHGTSGPNIPANCSGKLSAGLIGRADKMLARLVGDLTRSAMWNSADNNAIVITFDENDDDRPSPRPNGCCGMDPSGTANPGGGWIPTIVITNHGPRGLNDPVAYNHYSLLRTIEAAFGIAEHLGHAGDTANGVATMTPLFAIKKH
ncbi:MAG TPA: alkaline phosphatase family protein [Rhizomicrobium sp.]|nr:alkaline phosphatase family protein [Rhizomicrobium sp.]